MKNIYLYKRKKYLLNVMKSSLILIILLLSINTKLFSTNVDAGEDKVACPGVNIELGGSPTAGPDATDTYYYYWEDDEGKPISFEANPTIIVPDRETVYTVTVVDAEGFECSDQVKVTPVVLGEIVFPTSSLPADGSSYAVASITTDPPGREVYWAIEGDNLGCTIDNITGTITAGTIAGYIHVRAYDKAAYDAGNYDCYVEKPFCIGNDCCNDITSSRTFGPFTVTFSSTVVANDKDNVDDWCSYETDDADIHVETNSSTFSSSYDLYGASISWSEKDDGSSYTDVIINWEGSSDIKNVGVVQFNLTKVNASVASDGTVTGNTFMSVAQTQEKPLGGMYFLDKNISGTFNFVYSGQSNFNGNYDFSGVTNVNILAKKGSSTIASLTGNLDVDGNINGAFSKTGSGNYSTNDGFSCQLIEFNLNASWNIANSNVQTYTGTGKIEVVDVKYLKGKVLADLSFADGEVIVSSSNVENLTVCTFPITGSVEMIIDTQLEFNLIQLPNSTMTVSSFDKAFTKITLVLSKGELDKLESNNTMKTMFNGGVLVSVAGVTFDKKTELLKFKASLAIYTYNLEIKEFSYNQKGEFQVAYLKYTMSSPPVFSCTIEGKYDEPKNTFGLKYDGTFLMKSNLTGTAIFGTAKPDGEEPFNHLYLAGALQLPVGIPAFQVLKVNKIGIEIGANWVPKEGDDFATLEGEAKRNYRTDGVLIGGADLTGQLLSLDVLARSVTFSGSKDLSSLTLKGTFKALSSAPYITNASITGILSLDPNFKLQAIAESDFSFPPANQFLPSIIVIPQAKIDIGVEKKSSGGFDWWLKTGAYDKDGQKATFLNYFTFTGKTELTANSESMLSTIKLHTEIEIEANPRVSFKFPLNFDASSCETAKATSSWFFGVDCNMLLNIKTTLIQDIMLESQEYSFTLDVFGNADAKVLWPTNFFEDECLTNYKASVYGNGLTIKYKDKKVSLSGKIIFINGDEKESADIDYVF